MRISPHIFGFIVGLVFVVIAGNCGSPKEESLANKKPASRPDEWLVSGRIAQQGYASGEVVALGMDGTRYRSKIGQDDSFALQLPHNSTYAVYFLPQLNIEKDDVVSGSEFISGARSSKVNSSDEALLYFEDSPEGLRDTLRLPKIILDQSLSLGEIDIKKDGDDLRAFPTNNPAIFLDYDADGINDFADLDDQNDGLSDQAQSNELDRVDICHYTDDDSSSTQSIPLSHLFDHISHGDSIGPCQHKKEPPRDEDFNTSPAAPGPSTELPAPAPAPSPLINSPVLIEETVDEEGEGENEEDEEDEKDEGKGDEDEDKDKDKDKDEKDDTDENKPKKPKKDKKKKPTKDPIDGTTY
jgi:hypothetical protein